MHATNHSPSLSIFCRIFGEYLGRRFEVRNRRTLGWSVFQTTTTPSFKLFIMYGAYLSMKFQGMRHLCSPIIFQRFLQSFRWSAIADRVAVADEWWVAMAPAVPGSSRPGEASQTSGWSIFGGVKPSDSSTCAAMAARVAFLFPPCQPLRERTSTGHGYCVQTPDARGHACLRSAVLAIGALSIGHDGEASPRRRLLRPPPRAHNVPGHMRSLPPPATQFPPSIQLQLQSCAAPARPACCRELARPLAN